jgi:SAM-dependent methyltransferase
MNGAPAMRNSASAARVCWCGEGDLVPYADGYESCSTCGTLVSTWLHGRDLTAVLDENGDLYGREYWFSGQLRTPGLTTIVDRARTDLVDRCPQWMQTILKYKHPPGRILELGSSHGGFVALLRAAGFDAAGLELSASIVELSKQMFEVPVYRGPLENQDVADASLDVMVLMDVLEHLEDPVRTLRTAAAKLQRDGILVIQTPEYPGRPYPTLAAESSRFLEMLRPEEHLFLFSRESVQRLLTEAGFPHVAFEPAVFGHYDMFAVASAESLSPLAADAAVTALQRLPSGRMVLALLDLADRHRLALDQYAEIVPLIADVEYLKQRLMTSEADRAARQRDIAEARALLAGARQGLVVRVARTLRPGGVDAALARADALLGRASGEHEPDGC